MIKKKTLLTSITVSIGISILLSASVDAASQTNRLWGKDRYETCSAIVQTGWTGTSDYAVIVNGENFPDALSATSLAKKYKAPILLTQSSTLDSNTSNQLKRLNVKNVIIVGGTSVVTASVEDAIRNLGIEITRYEGQNRNETSVKVAEQIGTENGIILTTESDYTDALSAAPIAAKLQMPIILMPKDTVPDSVKSFLTGRSIPKTYILGGTDLISDAVASEFSNVIRIDGKDKYERNINIIKTFSDSLDFKNICVAYSEKFADALSGSAFAAIDGNPILLLGSTPSEVTKNFLSSKTNLVNNLYVFGGTAGVTDDEVNQLLGSSSNNTGTSSDNNSIATDSNEGNTTGNLLNGGFIVQKDNWLYYTKNGTNIYKSRIDGTEETKLADAKDCRSINVIGDYIFYVSQNTSENSSENDSKTASIFRINTSGNNKTVFNTTLEDTDKAAYPYVKVVGKSLYYSPEKKFLSKGNAYFYNELYKLDIDKGTSDKVSGYYFDTIDIENDYIYFTRLGDKKICKMNSDGENEEYISGCEGEILYVSSGWIYYKGVDGNTYRVKTDGTSKTKIIDLSSTSIPNGENIYYVSPGQNNLYQLHKTNINGAEDTSFNAYKVDSFSIAGDWLYYISNKNLLRIKLDGSSRSTFPVSLNINKIDDLHVKVKQGQTYSLPQVVWAQMSDESADLFNITWNTLVVDTSKTGTYEFYGTVDGYSSKVKITLEVY